jgi:excinuclease ABC subunit C
VPGIPERLKLVPDKPGVYLFRDRNNTILYVGKAKELRNRIRSYFQRSAALDSRKSAMVGEVADFEYTVTANELEAFVLEANLIKQYRPRYNILLRDDKSYPYLKLTVNEQWPCIEVVRRVQKDGARYFGPYVPAGAMWSILSFIRNNFHIRTCRRSLDKPVRPCIQSQIKRCVAPCSGKVDHKEYLTMVNEVRLLLEGKNKGLIESLEKRMRKLSEEMRYEEAAVERDRIRAIKKVTEFQKAVAPGLGDVDVIGLHRKENACVFKILFVRNGVMVGSRHFFLKGIYGETDGYLTRNFVGQFYTKQIIPPREMLCSEMPEDAAALSLWLSERRGGVVTIKRPMRGLRRKLVEMAEENARILAGEEKDEEKIGLLQDVASFLKLRGVPRDIGAFDISNISGREPVGSFVYWADEGFHKEWYRHIRMDAVGGPDDYAMMREMIKRTFRKSEVRSQKPEVVGSGETSSPLIPHTLQPLKLPDLIIIDGGRAHLDVALEVFRENNITGRDVIAVAKDPDRVFLPGREAPLSLEDGSPASLLLRRIRDEAHRFAIRYHKKRRAKKAFESPLEKIPGIARKRRFELLRHFGSIEAIRKSTVEEISSVKGFNRKLAEKVLDHLTEDRTKKEEQ